MKLSIVSATENTFALFDAFDVEPLREPADLAIALCRASGRFLRGVEPRLAGRLEVASPLERALDGLLILAPSDVADARMILYNADGSRPEACGNGLRCTALAARANGRVVADLFRIETDAGVRRAELDGRGSSRARVSMGVPKLVDVRAELATSQGKVAATIVDLGNPHCVLFVDDLAQAPVETLGAELERHSRFPHRTNVEFAAMERDRMELRVWERGVGETRSCGTGACAAAIAAFAQARAPLPIDVALPGGVLEVDWDGGGEVWLRGECRLHGAATWTPDGAEAGVLIVPHRLPRELVRRRILELAERHGIRVEAHDDADRGVISKAVPFLGLARARYRVTDDAISIEVVERPRGLSEATIRRALEHELQRLVRV